MEKIPKYANAPKRAWILVKLPGEFLILQDQGVSNGARQHLKTRSRSQTVQAELGAARKPYGWAMKQPRGGERGGKDKRVNGS